MGFLNSEWAVSGRRSIILHIIFFVHLKLDYSDFFPPDYLIYKIFELGLHFYFVVKDCKYTALSFHSPVHIQLTFMNAIH